MDKEDFECPLCLKLLCVPCTTACGHSFCLPCIRRAIGFKRQCPLCRAELSLGPGELSPCSVLALALERTFPRDYEERKAEIQQELDAGRCSRRLPVFLSNSIQLPHQMVNLHIFEMRYRCMISQAIAGSREFVIATPSNGSDGAGNEQITAQAGHGLGIGCVVKIKSCNGLVDGRSLVSGVGMKRVVLRDIMTESEDFGLISANIENIEDLPTTQNDMEKMAELREKCLISLESFLQLCGTNLQRILETPNVPDIPQSLVEFPFWMSGLVYPSGQAKIVKEYKASMLKSSSPLERMELAFLLVNEAIRGIKIAQRTRVITMIIFLLIISVGSLYKYMYA